MKIFAFAAGAALLVIAGAAQAQIKAGIPPKPMSQIRAERAAKLEQIKLRDADAQASQSAFKAADRDGDGKLDAQEFRDASNAQAR